MTLRRTLAIAVVVLVGLSPARASQLGSRSAEEWVRTLESPARIENLKIDETIRTLQLKPGDIFAAPARGCSRRLSPGR